MEKENNFLHLPVDKEQDAIRIEVVRMLYESSTRSLIVSTLVAASLIFCEFNFVPLNSLLFWGGIFLTTYLIRYAICINYHRQQEQHLNTELWLTRFRISTTACGMTWGLSSLLFYQQSIDTIHQPIVFVILIGVSGGAIITYSIDSITAKLFAGGVLVFTLPTLLFPVTPLSLILGLMILIYIFYISISGAALTQKLRENMLMRITAHKQEKKIKILAERQKLHIDLTPMGVIEWDINFNVISWNKSAESIFRYSFEEAMNINMNTITPLDKQEGLTKIISKLFKDGGTQHYSDESLRRDGKIIYCEWIYTILTDNNNKVIGLASLVQDKSTFKKNQDEINFLAYYDLLTNLPNRRLLMNKLEQSIITTKRSNSYGCVLFIDLDNFKNLNDLHGHQVGDLLLKEVAYRLKKVVREEDITSRFAGDEFVIILEKLGEELNDAMVATRLVVNKILSEMNRVYLLGEHEHRTSSSVGISMFKGSDLSPDEVLKRADIAMFQAKKAGRNGMQFFNVDLQPKLELKASLASDLRGAELNVDLIPYYQAQVDQQHNVIGAELLLRWIHPKYGFIPPDQFIPIAEESRLINSIGKSILRHACQQIRLWESKEETNNLRLSINISARHFGQSNFVDEVKEALNESKCSPHLLRFELTESLMQQDIENLAYKMRLLKNMGVSLSLDDFGTGYSSLSSLRSFPLDELKIDRSFVKAISSNKSDAIIIEMIIEISKKLGMEVIAEGIETIEQESFLRDVGCLFYQGYRFGRPVPLDEFEQALQL
jgi:diguanylate cyclase (GGDEF)-like protein/PAS domain S-box-containing protein